MQSGRHQNCTSIGGVRLSSRETGVLRLVRVKREVPSVNGNKIVVCWRPVEVALVLSMYTPSTTAGYDEILKYVVQKDIVGEK